MLVIAVDTSTPAVTAGLVRVTTTADEFDATVLATRTTLDSKAHAEVLTPHILECLAAAGVENGDVDAVVVGTGPGPYTGLRVGMATAAAYGDALSIPVFGVCSLDAIAAEVDTQLGPDSSSSVSGRDLLVVTDARRREVYWARYSGGVRVAGPDVTAPGDVDAAESRTVAGSHPHAVLFGLPISDVSSPSPLGLILAARHQLRVGADPTPLVPLYLRRPDAATLEERAAAKAASVQVKSTR